MTALRAALLLLLAVAPVRAATFVVTTTDDVGTGSLRQAIVDANGDDTKDTIAFAIGSGTQTIVPASPLPAITQPVEVDGTTQPGFAGTPIVEIDGTDLAVGSAGLILQNHAGSTIHGLVINRIPGDFVVGGGDAILIDGGGGHTIQGNYLGTDPAGTLARPNKNGVRCERCDDTSIVGNLISANTDGILVSGGIGNTIQGNFIGTDATGTAAIVNTRGVLLIRSFVPERDAEDTLVGGTTPAEANLISGNATGVVVASPASLPLPNRIEGNLIGTDVTGLASLPNRTGVYAEGASGLVIGGAGAGAGNVLAGNHAFGIIESGYGVQLGGFSDGVRVQGNFIGTDASGTVPIANDVGVIADTELGPVSNSLIVDNVIRHNDREGVLVVERSGKVPTGNTISRNSIFANGELGIDLAIFAGSFNPVGDGVTDDDAGDADEGPNRLQNFPVLASATTSAVATAITGTLEGPPDTPFVVEFFTSSDVDASGHGEGETFLGDVTVMTNGSGVATIDHVLDVAAPVGKPVTATATDPDGNTSEFSAAIDAVAGEVTTTSTTTTSSSTTTSTSTSTTTTTSEPTSTTTSSSSTTSTSIGTTTSSTAPTSTTTTSTTTSSSSTSSSSSTTSSTSTTTSTTPSTTTTTTTFASTSSTTTSTSSTTTTTAPPGCSTGASLESLLCRLDALVVTAGAIDLGKLERGIARPLAGAQTKLRSAQVVCAGGNRTKARKALGQAARLVTKARRASTSKKGRKVVMPDTGGALITDTGPLAADIRALRSTLACP